MFDLVITASAASRPRQRFSKEDEPILSSLSHPAKCEFVLSGRQQVPLHHSGAAWGGFFTSSASDGPQRGDSGVFTFTPPVMMLLPRAQNPLEVKLDQIGSSLSESS